MVFGPVILKIEFHGKEMSGLILKDEERMKKAVLPPLFHRQPSSGLSGVDPSPWIRLEAAQPRAEIRLKKFLPKSIKRK